MSILNFTNGLDAFEDEAEQNLSNSSKIHIKIQQRNGRKSITLITGLPSDLDLKKILKNFKKSLNCNGCISEDEEFGKIIQLQGDHRASVKNFILEQQIASLSDIVIHSF